MKKLPPTKSLLLLAAACSLFTFASAAPSSATSVRVPGKFAWFDLATADPAAAQQFYGGVFGWTFQAGADGFTLIQHEGRDIGGIFAPPKAPAAARWISLIAVTDTAAAVQTATKQGGQVLIPPTTLAWRGTHALLRDADGALIGLLQPIGDAPDRPVTDGNFYWADLLTPVPQKAAEFYRTLVGYEVSEENFGSGVDHLVLSAGGFARASVSPLPASLKQPGWLPFVLVSDVAATLGKAVKAGGKVLLSPRPELLDSQLAVIADPTGGVIGIVNWTSSEK